MAYFYKRGLLNTRTFIFKPISETMFFPTHHSPRVSEQLLSFIPFPSQSTALAKDQKSRSQCDNLWQSDITKFIETKHKTYSIKLNDSTLHAFPH